MRSLKSNPNVDNSDPTNYPDGRIKDNTGSNDGTAVNERVKGDLHQFFEKIMRLAAIVPNDLPDNETNGFQLVDAVRALASKNDFVYNLTSSSLMVLQVPFKLGTLLENEVMLLKSSINVLGHTSIRGLDNVSINITKVGIIDTNDYVMLIKNATNITLIKLINAGNANEAIGGYGYLKGGTDAQEKAGTSSNVATTPLSNKSAFTQRVIGTDSVDYLATLSRNGLYPKEHFAAVLDLLNQNKNKGWFSGLNISSSAGALVVSGGSGAGKITAANAVSSGAGNETNVTVTMSTPMNNTNYKINVSLQSESADIYADNDVCIPVWKPISTTQFLMSFKETASSNQSLKVHVEVIQL